MSLVVHIHRQPRVGAYSIENVFNTVANELRNQGLSVIDYQLGSRRRLLLDILALRRLKADVYHVTGDVNYIVQFLPRGKVVLTVHDIGHYLTGLSGWRRQVYRWFWLLLPLHFASRITAVSESTRDNLIKHMGRESAEINVIENCYNPIFHPVIKSFNDVCPRILQVGTSPYKNVPRLIRALRSIACQLVLIGPIDNEIQSAIVETGVIVENYVGISDKELHQEYAKADIVAFVSIGEGFGVPIIEAQAMGRPLLTANIPPMSVAAGEGASLADPLSVSAIRLGILRLIQDAIYRDQVVEAGIRNVAAYSPYVVAQKYMKVYAEIARL